MKLAVLPKHNESKIRWIDLLGAFKLLDIVTVPILSPASPVMRTLNSSATNYGGSSKKPYEFLVNSQNCYSLLRKYPHTTLAFIYIDSTSFITD